MNKFSQQMEEWIASRPPHVAEKVRAYPHYQPYRLKTTGQKVWIYSYSESKDGKRCETCWVNAYASDNPNTLNAMLIGDVQVFGISFTDLEPWTDD